MILLTILYFFAATLPPDQAREIGMRVWQNECAATLDGLLSWNKKEEFASLGIGHFIWYPAKRGIYKETFPSLISFLKSKGVEMPLWVIEARHCPWKNRQEFERAKGSKKMMDLKRLLKETIALQAEFMAERLDEAHASLESHAPRERKTAVLANYKRLSDAPGGLYALLDYVNFKGMGTASEERYQGVGWGLLQVLEGMSQEGAPLDEFIRSAKEVLTRRVQNAPAERNEPIYLDGWCKRIDTYRRSVP